MLFTAVLALVPVAWMVRHRGARRPAGEGKLDGALLLGALVCSGIAITLMVVAIGRAFGERNAIAGSSPLPTTVAWCGVGEQRTGGRDGARTFELRCDLTYGRGVGKETVTVRAGYLSSRESYEKWTAAHPPGSPLVLRRGRGGDTTLLGFDQLVPSTTTAAHSRRQALLFALVASAFLVLSRAAARFRPGGPGNTREMSSPA